MPPWICPSTIIGLITVPTSSTPNYGDGRSSLLSTARLGEGACRRLGGRADITAINVSVPWSSRAYHLMPFRTRRNFVEFGLFRGNLQNGYCKSAYYYSKQAEPDVVQSHLHSLIQSKDEQSEGQAWSFS